MLSSSRHNCKPSVSPGSALVFGSTLFILGELGFVTGAFALEQGIALYNPRQSHTRAFSRATDPGVDCLSREAWGLCLLGYPDQALTRSREALALAARLSHPHSLAFALTTMPCCIVPSGRLAVLEQAAVTITFMQEHGFVQWLGGHHKAQGIGSWSSRESSEDNMAQLHQGVEAERIHKVELGLHTDLAILARSISEKTKQARRADVC